MNQTSLSLADHLRSLEKTLGLVTTLFQASVYQEHTSRLTREENESLLMLQQESQCQQENLARQQSHQNKQPKEE
jgi:hypothetical protein